MSTSLDYSRTETPQRALPGQRGQTFGVRGVGQGIYEQSATPLHRLGDRLALHGGRVFYYGHFGAAAAAGVLVAPDASDNDEAESDNTIVVSGNYGGAIGDKKIEITLASQTKDDHAEGTFHTTDDTGEGYCYLIKGNSATGSLIKQGDPALNATTSFIVELYDGLVVAVDATTDWCIQGSLFDELDEATTTDRNIAGVTMRAMTSGYYGWIQTWGVCTVLADCASAIAVGDHLIVSDDDAGAVQLQDAYNDGPPVGFALMAPDDTGHAAIMLQIMP